MGIGVRVFFVENEGRVKRISVKRFQSLIDSGQDVERLPDYAGQRLRITIVLLEVKEESPFQSSALIALFWYSMGAYVKRRPNIMRSKRSTNIAERATA
jgi:hypothetical protein